MKRLEIETLRDRPLWLLAVQLYPVSPTLPRVNPPSQAPAKKARGEPGIFSYVTYVDLDTINGNTPISVYVCRGGWEQGYLRCSLGLRIILLLYYIGTQHVELHTHTHLIANMFPTTSTSLQTLRGLRTDKGGIIVFKSPASMLLQLHKCHTK